MSACSPTLMTYPTRVSTLRILCLPQPSCMWWIGLPCRLMHYKPLFWCIWWFGSPFVAKAEVVSVGSGFNGHFLSTYSLIMCGLVCLNGKCSIYVCHRVGGSWVRFQDQCIINVWLYVGGGLDSPAALSDYLHLMCLFGSTVLCTVVLV